MIQQPLSVLCLIETYAPGYKAGGPVRSAVNLVEALGSEIRFKVITLDRDLNDTEPYKGITPGTWTRVGQADVVYLPDRWSVLLAVRRYIKEAEHQVIYLNSLLNPRFTILPLVLRRVGLIPVAPVILAPRGELSEGALGLKRLRKRVYLTLSKAAGLYRHVIWQASSPKEEMDIRRVFGLTVPVRVAPNLPSSRQPHSTKPRVPKAAGSLQIVFLSRLSRMKNLKFALETLRHLRGDIQFDVYGPIEDKDYWLECQRAMATLPPNVIVHYHGVVEHDQVADILGSYDVLFLPTLGENFGHVILEALASGCPVLISDRTPWRDLMAQGIGWEFPLENHELFWRTLQDAVDMDNGVYQLWSQRAREFGLFHVKDPTTINQSLSLFQEAGAISFKP